MNLSNGKPLRLSIIVMLTLIVALPIIFPQSISSAQNQSGENVDKQFAWDYAGKHWTWNLSIPKALYNAYKEVPVYTRTRNGPEGYGYMTTTEDYYIKVLAQELNETASNLGYDSYDQVSFVLAFVQSLPYTSDNVTEGYNEYPRFPIETLVDGGGDCEDTAILFGTITLILGYGTVYINPPNHFAVGVLGNDLNGAYFTYENKTYYYCETTGANFKIGQLPDEFQNQKANIYTIDENSQFIPNIKIEITEPTPTQGGNYIGPTPSFNPNQSPSPTISQPTVQPVAPLTKAITDNPIMFFIIILAIMVSIIIAFKSVQKPKQELYASQPVMQETTQPSVEENKFCIYCGSNNQGQAVYCEKCGKQIG